MKFLIRHGGVLMLFLFAWLPASWGQSELKVAKVIITNVGPSAVSEDLVRANIHVKPGDPYVRTSVDNDVRNLYATGFFSNIQVRDQLTDQGVVVTYILQGKFRLTGINFEGNTKFSNSKLLKKVTSKVGEPVDERKLFNDSQEIQKTYEKAGYTHTTVKYTLNNIDETLGRASVTFEIKETPRIKIVEVDFTGAHAFTQKKLRHVIKTRKHWMFSWLTGSGKFKEDQFEDDKEKLADFYRSAGYIDFEIKDIRIINPTPKTMRIEFVISEGNLYKVGAVTFKGNKVFTTAQIVAGLKQQHDRSRSKAKIGPHGLEADVDLTFTPGALNHDLQAISDFFGAKGYIDVRQGPNLRVTQIPNTETGTMDLEYLIDEGEKSYIERIEIKGNTKTKDKVIRRELAVSPGEVFDMVRVRLSKQRLEGLQFFEKVDTKPEATDIPSHKNLIVSVEEKRTASITAGAGYNTVESISGIVEVTQSNFDLFNPPYFSGGGQKLRLRVQLGTLIQDERIDFEEPWFLNRKLRLNVSVYHSVTDYQSLNALYDESRTGLRVGATRALGSDFLIGNVNATLEQVGIINANTNAPNAILADSGYSLLERFGGSLAYDTRNGVELPNKGQRTELSSVVTIGDREFVRAEIASSWYFKGYGKGDVLEVGGRAGVEEKLGSRDVPFYDRFYLGGQNSLRGFDYRGVGPRAVTQDGTVYEPIGGDTYWFSFLEYSIPIIDRLRFALFYDIGNVSASPFSNSPYQVIGRNFTPGSGPLRHFSGFGFPGSTGSFSDDYGLGLRLNIPTLGPLRLDYGIPIHHDNFNSSSGKFQFGVGFVRPL